MFTPLILLLLPLTLSAAPRAEPPAATPLARASGEPAAAPAADPAAYPRLLAVLHGEADEATLPGNDAPKPARLTGVAAKAEPLFTQAAARRSAGDAAGAREILHQALALPRLDSRRALRAWKGLRDLGEIPETAAAGQVLGVVVEFDFEVEGEHALLAVAGYAEADPVLAASSGYSLLGARLRTPTVAAGRQLVAAAQPVLADVPPEDGRRSPGNGQIRFALLTPGGVHAREIARRELETEPLHPLRPLYIAAQQLLAALRLESERLEEGKNR
jgi:hypothetical protein